jgi:hypothetical protein
MSTERKHRHVLDELLARSVQVPRTAERRAPRRAGDPASAGGTWDESADNEETPTVWAPGPRPAGASSASRGDNGEVPQDSAAAGVDTVPAEQPAKGAPRPEPRSPIIRDARRDRPLERRPARSQTEVQVGRGPLELHLSRAATEERLTETGERLGRTERSLKEARERLSETERHLEEARERLAQTEGRLAEARKHVLASEERLAMTEASERHAREEQARAEESSRALAAQLPALQERERALAAELGSERSARVEAELELARLRGSLLLLSPIVSGIEQATTAIGRDVADREHPATRAAAEPASPAPEGAVEAVPNASNTPAPQPPQGARVPPPASAPSEWAARPAPAAPPAPAGHERPAARPEPAEGPLESQQGYEEF